MAPQLKGKRVAALICIDTVEPSIKGPSEKETTSLHRTLHISNLFFHNYNTFEKRTVSIQTKWLVPKCPLLGGSNIITYKK